MDEYKRRRRRSRAVMSMFLDSIGGSIDNVDVATFDSDGNDLKALIVGIDPVQDLHGYDSPWPAGGGKNKADLTNPQLTINTTQTVATLNLTGTYTIVFSCDLENANYEAASAAVVNLVANGSNNYRTGGQLYRVSDDASLSSLTRPATGRFYAKWTSVTNPERVVLYFMSSSYGKWSGQMKNVQVELSETPTSFAPYSNECPITGHGSVNVIVSPTLNPLDGTITNITLGTTVYGGQLDVLPGVLTDADAEIASYNGETINEPWISSMDAYSPGATPTTGAQVVYPLATPQTIQLTGQQIATFLGTNHVWCDSGKIIHLEY